MLVEMGIKPLWRLRSVQVEAVEDDRDSRIPEYESVPIELVREDVVGVERAPESPPARAPLSRKPFRDPRIVEPAAPVEVERLAPRRVASATPVSTLYPEWSDLEEAVVNCRKCRLCERRKQAVLGVGDRQADWMLVGEGPGAEEDERGEPFVGQAGRLLDNMLAAINLRRGENVYIANAVKCRPPGNRTPELDEIETCRPYLERQIELVRPKLLIALGRPAAQTLLEREIKVGASRGQVFSYQNIPVVVTYHPAYLLRNLADKSKAWQDLCFSADQMERLKAG